MHSFGGQERSDFMDRSFSFSSCCVPSPFRFCYPEMRSLAGSRVCPHSSQPLLLLLSLSALCGALARPQCCRHCSTAGPPWSLSMPSPSALSEQNLGNGAKRRAMPALLLPIISQPCRAVQDVQAGLITVSSAQSRTFLDSDHS